MAMFSNIVFLDPELKAFAKSIFRIAQLTSPFFVRELMTCWVPIAASGHADGTPTPLAEVAVLERFA